MVTIVTRAGKGSPLTNTEVDANFTNLNTGKAAVGTNTDITSVALTTGTISTAPSANTDIANKLYVDGIASGLNFHSACNYATIAALAANTYNNGSSGVGATLTAVAVGTLTIDGYTLVIGDVGKRLLIKNEVAGANNGVYTLTQAGTAVLPYILTRATDYDTSGSGTNEIDAGDFILVLSGSSLSNSSWVQQTPLPITVGTTALTFTQFAAPYVFTYPAAGIANSTGSAWGASYTTTGTGTVVALATSPSFITPALGTPSALVGTNITGTAANFNINGTVGATTASTGAFTTLSASSTVSGTGFSTYLASPPAIGGTAAAAGAFTTLAASSTVSGTGFSTYLASPPAIGGTAAAAGAFTTLSASSTVSGTGFSTYLASPPAIGGTAAAAGSFTALAYTTTLTGGTGIIAIGTNQFYKDATGKVGLGTTNPLVTFAVNATDAVLIPAGTTAQQPTGVAGYLRFNTTTTQFEGHNGTTWASVGGAAISNDTTTATNVYPLFASATTGTALTVYTSNAKYLYKPSTGELQSSIVNATNGIHVNSKTVSTSYTIATGNSAMSVGKMTIASGQSVTVSSGSRWVIL